ncbi:lipopolysaccharide biosynthesis protein [Pseudomonas leptonychotis]|uniref:Polysaccharide biosynthesis protein n=1 Tax=Pseudomonas leptonychotis TaxID=2448482 RepID=A0A4T1ZU39_9PSED|nr:hypothetical protein [Pseudomonas leptonychotis]TIH06506.1 hypothetical protein D8779_19275 [Pseudomonas leptonychotis]
MSKVVVRFANVILRGATLSCKFLLIFMLASYLDPTDLGLYGLLVVSIDFAVFVVGVDFYTYSNRELIKRGVGDWGDIFKAQISVSLFMLSLVVPVFVFVFVFEFLPWGVFNWFIPLLVVEYFAQELNRVLVAISKQFIASVVLFVRSGVWVVAVALMLYYEPATRNLDVVLSFWFFGSLFACIVGVSVVCKQEVKGWVRPIDYSWVKLGLWVAFPFLLSTLALRGIFTVDRYWMESLLGLEALGAYVLFIGMANVVVSFLDAGVFVFIYPGLIKAHEENNSEAFRLFMRKLIVQGFVVGVSLSFALYAVLGVAIDFIDKPIFIAYEWMFPWIMLANLIYCLGMIPQFGLYAQGFDRDIVRSQVVSFAVFLFVVYSVSNISPEAAVIVGLICSLSVGAGWKAVMYFTKTPQNYRII